MQRLSTLWNRYLTWRNAPAPRTLTVAAQERKVGLAEEDLNKQSLALSSHIKLGR